MQGSYREEVEPRSHALNEHIFSEETFQFLKPQLLVLKIISEANSHCLFNAL